MPVNKNKGPNTCLCLLRKNLNNFTELSASDLLITSIIDRTHSIMKVHPASCFHYKHLALPVRNSVPGTV